MRTFLIFIGGLIVGGAALYLLFAVILPSSSQTPKQSVSPSQTTGNNTTGNQPNTSSPSINPRLKQMQQYMQQHGGVPLTATVDTVYPGLGFTLKDTQGSKIFVHWTQSPPAVGQQITVIGKPESASSAVGQFKDQPGYTQDLETFLQGQQYYVEAVGVTPMPSPTQ